MFSTPVNRQSIVTVNDFKDTIILSNTTVIPTINAILNVLIYGSPTAVKYKGKNENFALIFDTYTIYALTDSGKLYKQYKNVTFYARELKEEIEKNLIAWATYGKEVKGELNENQKSRYESFKEIAATLSRGIDTYNKSLSTYSTSYYDNLYNRDWD